MATSYTSETAARPLQRWLKRMGIYTWKHALLFKPELCHPTSQPNKAKARMKAHFGKHTDSWDCSSALPTSNSVMVARSAATSAAPSCSSLPCDGDTGRDWNGDWNGVTSSSSRSANAERPINEGTAGSPPSASSSPPTSREDGGTENTDTESSPKSSTSLLSSWCDCGHRCESKNEKPKDFHSCDLDASIEKDNKRKHFLWRNPKDVSSKKILVYTVTL